MKNISRNKGLMALALIWTMSFLPMVVTAQTRVNMPKNKYKVQDDVKLGRDATTQINQQFPILNDNQAEAYVERVGGGQLDDAQARELERHPAGRPFELPVPDGRFAALNWTA